MLGTPCHSVRLIDSSESLVARLVPVSRIGRGGCYLPVLDVTGYHTQWAVTFAAWKKEVTLRKRQTVHVGYIACVRVFA